MPRAEFTVFAAQLVDDPAGHGRAQQTGRPGAGLDFEAEGVDVVVGFEGRGALLAALGLDLARFGLLGAELLPLGVELGAFASGGGGGEGVYGVDCGGPGQGALVRSQADYYVFGDVCVGIVQSADRDERGDWDGGVPLFWSVWVEVVVSAGRGALEIPKYRQLYCSISSPSRSI